MALDEVVQKSELSLDIKQITSKPEEDYNSLDYQRNRKNRQGSPAKCWWHEHVRMTLGLRPTGQ